MTEARLKIMAMNIERTKTALKGTLESEIEHFQRVIKDIDESLDDPTKRGHLNGLGILQSTGNQIDRFCGEICRMVEFYNIVR